MRERLGQAARRAWCRAAVRAASAAGYGRTFLTEQRALLRELSELEHAVPSIRPPVLLLADPHDTVIPVETAGRLAQALPHARLQLVGGAGATGTRPGLAIQSRVGMREHIIAPIRVSRQEHP